jgi:glycosyltransferase involved in cell wall biosynthesis
VRQTLRRSNVDVVYNAVDLPPARANAGSWLDVQAGFSAPSSDVLRVGLIATYARWKGQDTFLRAIARVAPEWRARMRFFIVGGPIYQTAGSQFSRAELESLAGELGVEVGFVGFTHEVSSVLSALDILVQASSKPEPFGRTIAEGMAAGRAVIVAAAGGATELFRDGSDAVAAPPNDDAALAAAIERVARDERFRVELGVNARTTASRRYSRERLASDLLRIYDEVRGPR